jgi:PAS domain S-box-containing protein
VTERVHRDAADPTAALPEAPGARNVALPRRVLLVEDNPGDVDLVQIALTEEPAGYTVHHVERLGDALAYLSSRDVDAVLLDLGLPDSIGLDGVGRIREAVPELPVVILTGSYSVGVDAVRAGVQDYVLKHDLDPRNLRRALEYAIERNAHSQRARELVRERAAHAATQAAAKALEEANARLAVATREAREALDREAAARAQAEHRKEEIEALFASLTDPVLVYGEGRHIVSTNPAALQFFGADVRGLGPAEFIERCDVRSADGAKLAAPSLPAWRALDGEVVAGDKLRIRTPGGERVTLVSASPLWRGDVVRGATCVYRDITEQDRAEQALRENDDRKNHFLAMLSHELRNPLAPIRNSLYVLERAEPGGEQSRRARVIIDRQVHHLTRLVDDLLDVTRISRGKITLQRERVDLRALARQVADDHQSVFADRGIALEVPAGGPPLHVSGDPTRLAQVIGNLLNNAAKFTPRGGRAGLSVERAGAELASIRVRDTGQGIAPATLRYVFEPFVQGDRSLDRTYGGLGLGLALVKGLAELHGGDVTARSEGLGRGAEFVVRLPLDGAGEPRRGGEELAPGAEVQACRILVVEDNPDAAESLKAVLEMGGHAVEIAYSGLEGIDKARSFRPDVVLCDIGLPAMDGFAVARAIRADPVLRSTALVAVSGYAAPSDLERATESGFDRHLTKPVGREELERAMREVLRTRGAGAT